MRCNKCTDNPSTALDVLSCKFCRDDGTANEIPKHLAPSTPMETVLEQKPGLAARFLPDLAVAEDTTDQSVLAGRAEDLSSAAGESPAPQSEPKKRGRKPRE